MVYEPREDSFLLQKHVSEYARGDILDMGTGTGILAKEAAKHANRVLAVDIDQQALDYCKKGIGNAMIECRQSDLFSNVTESFDLIVFNPPYLPGHPKTKDVALDGGKKGYELTLRFLGQAKSHLKPNGKILLLISSHTNKGKVEAKMGQLGYDFTVIDSKKLDFEELYVYLVRQKAEIVNVENGNVLSSITQKTVFARGKRGIVSIGMLGNRKVAIKQKRFTSKAEGNIEREAEWLKMLNSHRIGPKFIAFEQNSLIYEFVEGEYLEDFLEKSERQETLAVLRQVLQQCRQLDMLGISKLEMTRPRKHVIVTKDLKAVMIDFERARPSSKPKNVTQLCQFLTLEHTESLLGQKGINIVKQKIIGLARKYKEEPSEANYKEILEVLK